MGDDPQLVGRFAARAMALGSICWIDFPRAPPHALIPVVHRTQQNRDGGSGRGADLAEGVDGGEANLLVEVEDGLTQGINGGVGLGADPAQGDGGGAPDIRAGVSESLTEGRCNGGRLRPNRSERVGGGGARRLASVLQEFAQ